MAIVGFGFDSMKVEKFEKASKSLKINHGFKVLDMEMEDIGIASAKEQVVKFSFRFFLDYDPKIAALELKGHVLYLLDDKTAKELIEEWKDKKKMSPDIMRQVINTIMLKSNVKALLLANEMNLPPHIKMPTLQFVPKKVAKKKVGKKKAK